MMSIKEYLNMNIEEYLKEYNRARKCFQDEVLDLYNEGKMQKEHMLKLLEGDNILDQLFMAKEAGLITNNEMLEILSELSKILGEYYRDAKLMDKSVAYLKKMKKKYLEAGKSKKA